MKMKKMRLNSKMLVSFGAQNGFTLIELISAMVIIGIMTSVGIKKLDLLSYSASLTALQSGVRELRMRETVAWAKIKLSEDGYSNDTDVYNEVDKNIGPEYAWNAEPNTTGGSLHFKGRSVDLSRVSSTTISPGDWK
jgi:prepilin-type N-terminal cleavage/methylation domain-containing protein